MDYLTWYEAEEYYAFYNKNEAEKIDYIFKIFAIRNLETTRLAMHGKDQSVKKYARDLQESTVIKENNLEDRFKGVDFGK